MKNLFNVNIKTKEHGYDEFLVRKPDSALKAQYDENENLLGKTVKKKYRYPMIASAAAAAVGLLFLNIFLDDLENTEYSFAKTYETTAWAFYLGIAGCAVFIVGLLYTIIGTRRFMANPQTQSFISEQSELEKRIALSLLVPEGSRKIDILGSYYRISRGAVKPAYNRYFENLSMWIYADVGNLYLADTCGVWAVPLPCITEILPVRGRINISGWNKPDKVTDLKYKNYVKVYNDKYSLNSRYSVRFTFRGEEWEILVPAYDVGAIEELTGRATV